MCKNKLPATIVTKKGRFISKRNLTLISVDLPTLRFSLAFIYIVSYGWAVWWSRNQMFISFSMLLHCMCASILNSKITYTICKMSKFLLLCYISTNRFYIKKPWHKCLSSCFLFFQEKILNILLSYLAWLEAKYYKNEIQQLLSLLQNPIWWLTTGMVASISNEPIVLYIKKRTECPL